MSTENIEGTFVLDGILEGQLHAEQAEDHLRQWISLLASFGLTVTLQVDGRHFTAFADNSSTQSLKVGRDPAEQIRDTLEQLVAVIGPVTANELFSTLRSVETQKGVQVRSVFALSSTDDVELQQDQVASNTQAPAEAVGLRGHLKTAGITLLIFAALLGVASLFVDIPGAIRGAWERVAPIDAEALEVDHAAFGSFFKVTKVERASGKGGLKLHIERGPAFPTTADARKALLAESTGEAHLIATAVVVGYVRCEIFDEEDTWQGTRVLRIHDLAKDEAMEVVLHVPVSPRPERITFRP